MDSDDVRKRKEYAERKVKERHAALRKEAEERRKQTIEHRERVQSQLKREQVLLQKRMQQLNEDEERKKTTLAKQHEATSRIAALTKSPKSFAFGSSTPRTLAYLDNLPKSEQQYDKKLRPLDANVSATSSIATSPTAKAGRISSTPSRPPPAAHKPAPAMTSMTSSMYVTSSAPPTRHAKTSIKPTTTTATKRLSQGVPSMMTQSVYTPTSRPATSSRLSMGKSLRGSTPTSSSRTIPPVPPTTTRRSLGVQKPPTSRKSVPMSKPDIKKEVKPSDVKKVPASPAVEPIVEAAPDVEEKTEQPAVAPIVEENPVFVEQEQQESENKTPEKVVTEEVKTRDAEKTESVLEELSIKTPEMIQVEENTQQESVIPEITVENIPEERPTSPKTEDEIFIASEGSECHNEDVREDSGDEKADTTRPEEPEKEELISLAHETSESNVGSSINTSLADELVELQQDRSHDTVEPSTPEVLELKYPNPDEPRAAPVAVNDLVDVFGNDFINGHPPQRIVDFDEDTDSGKASPTSSETSSTTDEVTPRSVIDKVKAQAPRVLPLVRSAEDIAKKEREAKETEERRTRLAEILAKTRGMASSVTLPPPPASAINSTPSPVTSPPTPPSPIPSVTEQNSAAPSSSSTTLVSKSDEPTEKTSNETGGASDVLARVAAKTNLPSLQKILQRKQGSNPSLQTSESTGGEIY